MFWQKEVLSKDFVDSKGNCPLHIGVLQNDLALLKKWSLYPQLRKKKNLMGLTPLDLAKYLNRSCLSFFEESKELLIRIEKDQTDKRYSKEEFEKFMELKYLDSLQFESVGILENVSKLCQKEIKNNVISVEQKWQGAFYERELFDGSSPKVYIKWIDSTLGYGLFAEEHLKPHTFIGEYVGLVRKSRPLMDKKNAYCFEYLIGWNSAYTIDAKNGGNLTRFINHSDQPNLEPLGVFSKGVMHIILRTSGWIQKDQQLTYDYGPQYWKKREKPR